MRELKSEDADGTHRVFVCARCHGGSAQCPHSFQDADEQGKKMKVRATAVGGKRGRRDRIAERSALRNAEEEEDLQIALVNLPS